MNTQDGVAFDTIPESLKEIPSWLVWKDYKVPYNASTGWKVYGKLSDHGSPFSVARKTYETGKWLGVGFILGGGIVGIDLDDCLTDGHENDFANDIVTDLWSYTEVSPRGHGLHIFVRGSIPGNIPTKPHEIYSHSHYFTVTGRVLRGFTDLSTDNDGVLGELYQRFSKPVVHRVVGAIPGMQPGNGYPPRTDEQVIQAIHTRGNPKFKALWNGAWGDLYKSQSEADVALVRYLWHFSNEYEPAQVDRLFRRSGLFTARPGKHTPKWDEYRESAGLTYGWRTISEVVDA